MVADRLLGEHELVAYVARLRLQRGRRRAYVIDTGRRVPLAHQQLRLQLPVELVDHIDRREPNERVRQVLARHRVEEAPVVRQQRDDRARETKLAPLQHDAEERARPRRDELADRVAERVAHVREEAHVGHRRDARRAAAGTDDQGLHDSDGMDEHVPRDAIVAQPHVDQTHQVHEHLVDRGDLRLVGHKRRLVLQRGEQHPRAVRIRVFVGIGTQTKPVAEREPLSHEVHDRRHVRFSHGGDRQRGGYRDAELGRELGVEALQRVEEGA